MTNAPQARTHRRPQHAIRGEALALVLIVLLILGGGFWYLAQSKRNNDKAARDFARDAAARIVLQQDQRFLDLALSPEAQIKCPPSWRSRLFEHIHDLGQPADNKVELTGSVEFTSGFFDPKGNFRAQISYPENPAILLLSVSHPRALWQIDAINFIWTPHPEPPPPAPSPEPSIQPTPSPTPSETPTPKKKRAKALPS